MFRLQELVDRLGGELHGDGTIAVSRVATLEKAGEGELAFLANRKYLSQVKSCAASALIVAPDVRDQLADRALILTPDPYLYFARVAQLFSPPPTVQPGVHRLAAVACAVPASVQIGPGASVEEGVVLGEEVVIGPNCHVGRGTRIGRGTRLAANVTIYHDCVIGDDCIFHSGVVIGADGFGFAREKSGAWVKIPQTGRVLIGNDVEIGANTTIDRGALDDTVIGDGVKLDNLIQIAHNVRIGDHTIMAGCAGVAGSAQIGARCMIGGQAGISGHLSIADDVVVSAWTLVAKSIPKPGVYTSNLPLQSHADWVRNFAHLRHLDALAKRVRQLEQDNDGPQDRTPG
ncbi:MAG TPA: UDP-3-O-(3-hydroxymyristoyl)glucosamine N-acyltransferase [Thauera sp.]|uniref:UDP-3-O-(3-hydroxymyristoyl)glucosamine N-acyltransferase n=1 Tax=Thauera sp. TaxID=1905334 RepID=UPI002CD0028A|nr:UDP-3-O-(3-hydroxymyristoyl)glucosamine N-acyltransferase [Thauera sp.]HRP23534.1 UDP-3-O-(3-hydroxymyristoyl)glucosamine N-acyltransferase [Thauera sp.]HRP65568.1 UDP-3-O-(3-hydroxymyristoyl)glucosamine N-acyltransferase [Thauera sp.]